MVASSVRLFEVMVIMFQVFGVAALCTTRLVPGQRWAHRGRAAFVVALFGLGIAGALCGRQNSEFGLFAGVTLTLLVIVMNMGNVPVDATDAESMGVAARANLAG